MIAREISEQSIVLLSNKDKTLPMNFTEVKNVLIVGLASNGQDMAINPITHGGGSGSVTASYIQSPVNELAKRFGIEPFEAKPNEVQRHCDNTNSRCVVYAGNCYTPDCIPDEFDYDAVIFFIGDLQGEGDDRSVHQFAYTEEIQKMVKEFSRKPKSSQILEFYGFESSKKHVKTVLVSSAAGAAVLPWENVVDAQIINFYAGEQMSQAIFNIIEGVTVPSGKLPITMPNKYNEEEMTKV